MYRSDLKRREAYTAYSNPRGFIYHNKDKKNKLMRIDELHKFSDDTLNDVRIALNDRLKGIQMNSRPEGLCEAWRNLLVGDRTRVTFSCCRGPYDLSYDVLILTERPSDILIFTMKMEILLEPTSNKLMVLPTIGAADSQRTSATLIPNEVLTLKNLKKDALLKLFKFTYQERYEHVGPEVTSSQDGKVYKMAKRDYAWLMISRCSRLHLHIQVKIKEQAQA
ncbi:hypothetical protein Tco_0520924 [Tanacetum coccineum]